MYLIRRTAMWLNKYRGGDIVAIADTFGMQLFGELDYVREANNCERFRGLYGQWDDVKVPAACTQLTRRKVLVMEWAEGTKGPWMGPNGIEMVRIGLRCSTDQLLRSGYVLLIAVRCVKVFLEWSHPVTLLHCIDRLFHADPHRGNLLRTPEGHLAVIDFGMMVRLDL